MLQASGIGSLIMMLGVVVIAIRSYNRDFTKGEVIWIGIAALLTFGFVMVSLLGVLNDILPSLLAEYRQWIIKLRAP